MIELIKAVRARLDDDATLCDLVTRISHNRNPQTPEEILGVVVVFRCMEGLDEDGLHGAATNPTIEIKLWGYGSAAILPAWTAAQRITTLFVPGFSITGGKTPRLRASAGWQAIDGEDQDLIHLQASYQTRYWSTLRSAAVST